MNQEKLEICDNCKKKYPPKKVIKLGDCIFCKECYKHLEKEFRQTDLLEDIRWYIDKIFSPLFNQTEIPEILFNPANETIRNDTISEFIDKVPKEVVKSGLRKIFSHITESTLHDKIMFFLGLFYRETGIDREEFEANKERIFGNQTQTIDLDDDFFNDLFKMYKKNKEPKS